MNLLLKFDDETLGPVASLHIERVGDDETWALRLSFEAATPALLEQRLDALRALAGHAATATLTHGGAMVRELAVPDCRKGPQLAILRETDDAPGAAHNRRAVHIELRATRQDAAEAVQSHTFTVRVAQPVGRPATITHQGRVILRAGEDPADHDSQLPATMPGWRRTGRDVTRDAAEPALDYRVTDEQIFTPLPAGVEDGHYVITESGAGRVISGYFVGGGARARALELRPSAGTARISENPFTRRVDFEFHETLAPGGVAALTEALTYTTTRRVVDHPMLDTALPAWRQQIGAPQTEVIQEGTAVGNGRHVSPPPPRHAADLLERRVHYSLPDPSLPPERRWVTSWRYVSRGRAALAEQPPREQA